MAIVLTKDGDGAAVCERKPEDQAALEDKVLQDDEVTAVLQFFKDEAARADSYIKIEFTLGLKGEAYQVVRAGRCIGFVDLDGNELIPPEVTESRVVEENPERPKWA